MESVANWHFKYFEFNKDSIQYDFPTNDYTVHMVFDHVQIYNKKMLNKTSVIRTEEQCTPNTTILEELDNVEFVRASKLVQRKLTNVGI